MHYEVVVRGKQHEWFCRIPENQAVAMREDGFEVIEVHNSMPMWVVDMGLTRVWVFVEDLWNIPSRLFRRRPPND